VGQLVLEGVHPALRLEGNEQVGDGAADGEGDEDLHRRASACSCEERDDERAADDQVRELDRAQRQVGPLQLALQLVPDAPVAERLLGGAEEPAESGEALAPLTLARLARALDMRGEAGLDPRAL